MSEPEATKPKSRRRPRKFEIPKGKGNVEIPQPTDFRGPEVGFRGSEGTRVRGPVAEISSRHGYNQHVALKICERLMQGQTLTKICSDPRMPPLKTVLRWLNDPRLSGFREHYYNARRIFAELIVEDAIELADATDEDWIPTYNRHGKQNGWKPNHDCVQRAKLRIDTRKWLAAKMLPRIYGDKLEVDHGVTDELKELLQEASNNDKGLPPPIEGDAEIVDE